MWHRRNAALFALLLALSPALGAAAAAPSTEPLVRVTLVQINDIYEIKPTGDGQVGGLARVATLVRNLEKANPNTLVVLAGDFFSPSALGTAKVDGKRLDGSQMVAVLNQLGLDIATLGNHEFDLKEGPFYERLAESRFRWVCGNATKLNGEPFPKVERTLVQEFTAPDGAKFRLGFVGATIEPNSPLPYAKIGPPLAFLAQDTASLAGSADAIVALTHLDKEQDEDAARTIVPIDLILGGHEHENWRLERGADRTPILKADANARTVFVHELTWHSAKRKLQIDSRLVSITPEIPEDPATAAEVERWVRLAYAAFRAEGFEPTAAVTTTRYSLDGREASVRTSSTALTELIGQAMLDAAPGAELTLYNSGSIRIDDVLAPGPVTQYDVIRILPFGGEVVTVEIPGAVLVKALDQGRANVGTGGFLQHANVSQVGSGTNAVWWVGEAPIDPQRVYRVAANDYLMSGLEKNLAFLAPTTPGVKVVASHGDVRQAVIARLKKAGP